MLDLKHGLAFLKDDLDRRPDWNTNSWIQLDHYLKDTSKSGERLDDSLGDSYKPKHSFLRSEKVGKRFEGLRTRGVIIYSSGAVLETRIQEVQPHSYSGCNRYQ